MKPVCNRDCFNCIFEDCVLDELNHDDYKQSAAIEKELLFPKSAKQKKIAAGQKAYYEANREKIAAWNKAYREANKEKIRKYQQEYRKRKKEEAQRVNQGQNPGSL